MILTEELMQKASGALAFASSRSAITSAEKEAILLALRQFPDTARVDASQRLQDHMEQYHGVSLQASDWDAAIRALTKEPS
jgi:hypothetical protein